MFRSKKVTTIAVILLGIGLLFQPKLSYADWSLGVSIGGPGYYHDEDHHHYGWHDHPHYGWHMHYLPDGYYAIWVGGQRYFYNDGLYYTYVGDGDYVLVNPPIGAYVRAIPPDFQPVSINGRIFYTNNGVYYRLTPNGYKVVTAPVYVQTAPVVVSQPAPTVVVPTQTVTTTVAGNTDDSFTINVPNSQGGYTSVVLKKSGNGFVGPQGEFYAEFPKVSQLKVMYGK